MTAIAARALVVLLPVIACAGSAGRGNGTRHDAPDGAPAAVAAVTPGAVGEWELTTQLDASADLLLPEKAARARAVLAQLSAHPARSLFELAELAGVPAVGTLRKTLPGALRGKLEGWLDDHFAGEASRTKLSTLETLARELDALTTRLELSTTLAIAATPRARHALTAVVFAAISDGPVSVPAIVSDVAAGALDLQLAADGALALGDHAFGLPLGQYAAAAVDLLAARRFGVADLRGALGAVVDCRAMAADVAGKCVLGKCVGHEADLTTICERGLDEAARQVRAELLAHDVKAVHFRTGRAAVRADRLEGGVWDAALNAGQGERKAPATFTGRRRPAR